MPRDDGSQSSSEAATLVSTGRLPDAPVVAALIHQAYDRYRSNDEGTVSNVYPALARVPRELFGLCVVSSAGSAYAAGDSEHEFTIMSVSKPFVFALVCEAIGPSGARDKLGVNATGSAFNSLGAIESGEDGRTNPMVNPGAIATTSLAPGANVEAKWRFIRDGLSRFAGRELSIDDNVYASATATNHRNQAIARLLASYGRIYCDAMDGHRTVYAAVFAQRERYRLSRDGIDARRRRRESHHARAHRGGSRLSLHASRHGDGGTLRDVGRLAIRHRHAR